ncbi:MAG: peptidylprolyl isomerase [Myxococcales bacterium]|nr:peptidylprolyl isomerase [Myxococcales bacterium]
MKRALVCLSAVLLLGAAVAPAQTFVRLGTDEGDILLVLKPEVAPRHVANFLALGEAGMYQGTYFHRVIPGFMIQGGDPTGTGLGNPGYVIEDEFSPEVIHDRPGILSMANRSQPNTGGSQFFITLNPTPHLDGVHTVFGVCSDDAVALADDISLVPRGDGDKPEEPETIKRVDFEWRAPAS